MIGVVVGLREKKNMLEIWIKDCSDQQKKLEIGDYEIEMEYQGETIEKYGVVFTNGVFQLTTTNTNCLALDKCGIPLMEINEEKVKQECTPGGGCC